MTNFDFSFKDFFSQDLGISDNQSQEQLAEIQELLKYFLDNNIFANNDVTPAQSKADTLENLTIGNPYNYQSLSEAYARKERLQKFSQQLSDSAEYEIQDAIDQLTQHNDRIKKAFILDRNALANVDIAEIAGITIPPSFRRYPGRFVDNRFYALSELNRFEMDFMRMIIELRVIPRNQNELQFLVMNVTRYFLTLGLKCLEFIKHHLLHGFRDLYDNDNQQLVDFMIKQFPNLAQNIDKVIQNVQRQLFTIPVVTFGLCTSSQGAFCFATSSSNGFILPPCLCFNYLSVGDYGWDYLMDVIPHEVGHWIDYEFQLLFRLNDKYTPQLVHNDQWLKLTQLAFGITPIVYSTRNITKTAKRVVNYRPKEFVHTVFGQMSTLLNEPSIRRIHWNCAPEKEKLAFRLPFPVSAQHIPDRDKRNPFVFKSKHRWCFLENSMVLVDGDNFLSSSLHWVDYRFYKARINNLTYPVPAFPDAVIDKIYEENVKLHNDYVLDLINMAELEDPECDPKKKSDYLQILKVIDRVNKLGDSDLDYKIYKSQ